GEVGEENGDDLALRRRRPRRLGLHRRAVLEAELRSRRQLGAAVGAARGERRTALAAELRPLGIGVATARTLHRVDPSQARATPFICSVVAAARGCALMDKKACEATG